MKRDDSEGRTPFASKHCTSRYSLLLFKKHCDGDFKNKPGLWQIISSIKICVDICENLCR